MSCSPGKKAGAELDEGPRIPAISDYLEKEFARLGNRIPGLKRIKPPETEPLNRLFREMLEEVWENDLSGQQQGNEGTGGESAEPTPKNESRHPAQSAAVHESMGGALWKEITS